ncbi:hypothetical protein D3W54_06850 [Komagataeibacter medellinensis]|uniref:Uncharacterized protein n=2 Tax=Komagataeibacter medellinensis TaxID=1177712 RepID=A0ABQ6VUS8_9PROT|nr:hypothetical protein D3W54_06850 [Komagataeibacter medellinensis]
MGTLSEEGITQYIKENHDIIKILCERGIMNSICSKNNFEQVKDILVEKGLWDYFIFPSIDWMPKGPRIKKIIENVQLRPASIMFIDDNPGNRGESQQCNPGLQVEDEKFVGNILSDPRFKGKDDKSLSRLKQYKILEKKSSDKQDAGGDNTEFLRQSGIVVEIDHNVENNIERAIELINRTNQLNFTKNRLPDDHDAAVAEFKKLITDLPYARTVGLVRVRDNYGDYGICGFYLCEQIHEWFVLKHFCFSCRILGMGVENWLYNQIGRPHLQIEGEVLSDPTDDTRVDWINTSSSSNEEIKKSSAFSKVKNIYLRGGCDLDAVGHYLRYVSDNIISDTNIVRNENLIRRDSLTNIYLGMRGLSDIEKKAVEELAFDPSYFHANFLRDAGKDDVILLSLAADATVSTYVSKNNTNLSPEFTLLMQIRGIFFDLVNDNPDQIRESMRHVNWDDALQDFWWKRVQFLRNNFSSFSINKNYYYDILRKVLERINDNTMVVIVLPAFKRRGNNGEVVINERANIIRECILDICKNMKNIRAVDIMSTVDSDEDFVDGDHIKRQSYYRLYQMVEAAIFDILQQNDGVVPPALEQPSTKQGTSIFHKIISAWKSK